MAKSKQERVQVLLNLYKNHPAHEKDRVIIDYLNNLNQPKTFVIKEALLAFMKTAKGKRYRREQ